MAVAYTHLDVYKRHLQKRVMEQAEWKLLPKAVAMVCSGEIE